MTSGKLAPRAVEAPIPVEKLALVIPTLQEAGNLRELLRRVLAALDLVPICSEVIVVDDDSRDGTTEIVTEIARADARVRILVREGERGLAGAVLYGWQHTDATLLGVMDADLQHPPELLPQLLGAMLCGSDLAVASRYTIGGNTGNWNAARRLVSRSSTWVTRPLLRCKKRVQDPMSGFFIIQRECVEGVRLQTTGFKLLLELLVRAPIREVNEVSFSFGVRNAGRSKANLTVAREYVRLLMQLYGERRSTRRGAVAMVSALPKRIAPVELPVAEISVPELSSLVLQ